jgi:hypothetical protein
MGTICLNLNPRGYEPRENPPRRQLEYDPWTLLSLCCALRATREAAPPKAQTVVPHRIPTSCWMRD